MSAVIGSSSIDGLTVWEERVSINQNCSKDSCTFPKKELHVWPDGPHVTPGKAARSGVRRAPSQRRTGVRPGPDWQEPASAVASDLAPQIRDLLVEFEDQEAKLVLVLDAFGYVDLPDREARGPAPCVSLHEAEQRNPHDRPVRAQDAQLPVERACLDRLLDDAGGLCPILGMNTGDPGLVGTAQFPLVQAQRIQQPGGPAGTLCPDEPVEGFDARSLLGETQARVFAPQRFLGLPGRRDVDHEPRERALVDGARHDENGNALAVAADEIPFESRQTAGAPQLRELILQCREAPRPGQIPQVHLAAVDLRPVMAGKIQE